MAVTLSRREVRSLLLLSLTSMQLYTVSTVLFAFK